MGIQIELTAPTKQRGNHSNSLLDSGDFAPVSEERRVQIHKTNPDQLNPLKRPLDSRFTELAQAIEASLARSS
jgi:hypothetical protein